MPFCPKCGKEVSAEASYCPSCGASLTGVDKDLLREKIAEARHNEMGASIGGVMGVVILFIGIFVGLITEKRYEWRGLTLYETTYHPYVDTAKILAILGIIIGVLSAILVAYYGYQRQKLMKQLESLT